MVQPGFAGCLTLELVNHGESPIALYAGSRIAQLAVHTLSGDTAADTLASTSGRLDLRYPA